MLDNLMLNRKKKMNLSTEKGFTLLEIITVLVIVGIFSTKMIKKETKIIKMEIMNRIQQD